MDETKIDIITSKILLVKKVLENCELVTDDTERLLKENNGNAFTFYTDTPNPFTDSTDSTSLRQPMTFSQIVHYRDKHPLIQNKTPNEFRKFLKKIYLSDRKIPTLADLNDFKSNVSKKDYCSRRKKIFRMMTLPGTTKGIIVEDPENVYRRTLYLKKIAKAREENRHIIYVNTIKNFDIMCGFKSNLVDKTAVTGQCLFVAVSIRTGLLQTFFYQDNSDEFQTSKWLLDILSPIREPCVVVIEEEDDEVPTLSRPKCEMSSWLTAKGILHDPKAHRGELHELITLAAKQDIRSRTDEVIIALGHEVLRYPNDVDELKFLYMLYENLIDIMSTKTMQKKYILDFLKDMDVEKWQELEQSMIDAEWYLHQEDMMMEKIIDGLCMMAQDGLDKSLEDCLIDVSDWDEVVSKLII